MNALLKIKLKASLDTNVIIHLYRADLQYVLFEVFSGGLIIYEQIRDVELKNHGEELLDKVNADIKDGKIELYTKQKLKELSVCKVFEERVEEHKKLYGSKDLGEVYAISLAETLNGDSIVTDDIKPGGPYSSLLQHKSNVRPFSFADVLILRFLIGKADIPQTIKDFNIVNEKSNLNWSFKSRADRFKERFFTSPTSTDDEDWIQAFEKKHKIDAEREIDKLCVMLYREERQKHIT